MKLGDDKSLLSEWPYAVAGLFALGGFGLLAYIAFHFLGKVW